MAVGHAWRTHSAGACHGALSSSHCDGVLYAESSVCFAGIGVDMSVPFGTAYGENGWFGGGGASVSDGVAASGGRGGGGNSCEDGKANSGGGGGSDGGGCGSARRYKGASGGSGVVLIAY
jgi:hypothetical protein